MSQPAVAIEHARVASWRRPLAYLLSAGAAFYLGQALLTMIGGRVELIVRRHPMPEERFEVVWALGALLIVAALLAWDSPLLRKLPALIIAGAVALYMGNRVVGGSGDTIPAHHLPLHLLCEGTLAFDTEAPVHDNPDHLEYYYVRSHGKVYSRYPLGSALLVLPVFLPSAIGPFSHNNPVINDIAKLGAALLTAFGGLMLFVVLRRLTSVRAAAGATFVFLAGTAALPILSQALWQHTGAAFGTALCLLGLFDEPTRRKRRGLLVGLGAGILVACRPVDVVISVGLGLALLASDRKAFAVATGVGSVLVALTVLYNRLALGTWLSGGYGPEAQGGWSSPFFEGLAGLTVSPTRGLFVCSPILIIAISAFVSPPLEGDRKTMVRISGATALAFMLMMSKWWAWSGGWCAGPRMLAETLPIWALGTGLAAERWFATPSRRAVAGVLAALSVATSLLLTYAPLTGRYFDLVIHPSAWDVNGYIPLAFLETRFDPPSRPPGSP
ncbi:MAG: hypothetical protein JST54_22225 [Deltaproteobacteria bacterium]|nr:hypothetical protein [Deltaproteobacteria bacterium]